MLLSNPESFPPWLAGPLFPVFFVALWLGLSAMFAYVSGWPALARYFRAAGPRPEGETVKGQVVAVGWVSENGVTHMIVADSGLYLYVNPLFRFLHPPLLLPWPRVRFRRERKFLFLRYYVFDLAGITSLTVTRHGYLALRHFARGRGGRRPRPT